MFLEFANRMPSLFVHGAPSKILIANSNKCFMKHRNHVCMWNSVSRDRLWWCPVNMSAAVVNTSWRIALCVCVRGNKLWLLRLFRIVHLVVIFEIFLETWLWELEDSRFHMLLTFWLPVCAYVCARVCVCVRAFAHCANTVQCVQRVRGHTESASVVFLLKHDFDRDEVVWRIMHACLLLFRQTLVCVCASVCVCVRACVRMCALRECICSCSVSHACHRCDLLRLDCASQKTHNHPSSACEYTI